MIGPTTASPESASPDGRPGSRRHRTNELLALLTTVLIGLVHLPLPFGGDAALMTVIGRQLADGDVLYRDILDLRQPALFWYARGAGGLFGFSEVGIHLAELVVLVAASVPMIAIMGRRLDRWRLAALTPLFTVGIYYLGSEVWQLTEPESFVGIPLFGVAWIVDRLAAVPACADRARPARMASVGIHPDRIPLLVALGALTAFVGLLKLTFLAIAGAMALIALVDGRRSRRLVSTIVWPAVGFLAVLGPLVVYYRVVGVLDDVMWLWFDYAPTTLERAPRPADRLWSGAIRFGRMWLPLLPLAALGLAALVRRRPVDRFLIALAVWLASDSSRCSSSTGGTTSSTS